MARRIAFVAGLAVLLSSGTYVFVYLYRWEWNRALMAAALFVAIEVALLALSLVDRLRSMSAALERLAARPTQTPAVLDRLRETSPSPTPRFAWLEQDGSQLSVFVPVLMGAGIVLSGVAWLVERIATRTATPILERGLALRLSGLSLPDALLGTRPADDLSILRGPSWPDP